MEVATRVGMVVTLVATEDIMEVMPATGMDGLQAAQRRRAISRIRILVTLLIRIRGIAPNSARSSDRRFQLNIFRRATNETAWAVRKIPARTVRDHQRQNVPPEWATPDPIQRSSDLWSGVSSTGESVVLTGTCF